MLLSMKKILGIIVLSLLLSGNAYAKKMTVKSLLDEGYKITKEELVEFDRYAQKIFTLKKRKQVKICTVRIKKVLGVSNYSKCMTP
tara:strand:- start:1720 stop:1977 length:258 start_codon:yes stop_codon:yes gene_type:complete